MSMCLNWSDNTYYIPNFLAEGVSCKTNMPTNTPMRAPGVLHSVWMIESVVEAVAAKLALDPKAVREANFYQVRCVCLDRFVSSFLFFFPFFFCYYLFIFCIPLPIFAQICSCFVVTERSNHTLWSGDSVPDSAVGLGAAANANAVPSAGQSCGRLQRSQSLAQARRPPFAGQIWDGGERV